MLGNLGRTLMAGSLLLLAAVPARAEQTLRSRDLARTASAALGGRLRLTGIQVADTGEAADFVLERFAVFAPDAEITIHGADGRTEVKPAPANVYFRGTVDGEPGSRVFLAVLADGGVQGLVNRAGEMYMIGGEDAPAKALGAPLEMRRIDPVTLKASRGEGFTCGSDKLPQGTLPFLDPAAVPKTLEPLAPTVAAAATPSYTARVAIETDYEFYTRFNNTITEVNYVANLIGYASTIYVSEISTSLVVQSLSLWITSNDPWTQTDSSCGLMEFGLYWNQNRTHVSRTIAHFMSGKAAGGGVAWQGVLCSGSFSLGVSCPGLPSSASFGGDYGFTGNLTGSFNIQSPSVVWDILAVSHEIGHNFGSPHSHCYGGIGGNASPIDTCPASQPPQAADCSRSGCGCTGTLPGPQGAGSGTIMSYCHLRAGNYSNITMTFGTGFSYGVAPGREAALMSSSVTSAAASNPSCLALIDKGLIFMDGFEVGTVSGAWLKTP